MLATGITRVAVSAAITSAADPACAAAELLGMLTAAKTVTFPAAEAASPTLTTDH